MQMPVVTLWNFAMILCELFEFSCQTHMHIISKLVGQLITLTTTLIDEGSKSK